MSARGALPWLIAMIAVIGAACTARPASAPAGAATHTPPAAVVAEQPAGPSATPAAPGAEALPPPQVAAASVAPSPTPQPATLRRLTDGGCCVGAFWSPDGRAALFLDRPDPNAPAGLWQAAIDGSGVTPATGRLGIYSADMQLRAFPEGGQTVVERLADGQRWTIPNGGRAVSFSPGGTRLAWTTGQSGPPQDSAQRTIWVSRVDGSEATEAATVTGGGFSGWLNDEAILVSGRPPGSTDVQVLARLNLAANGAPPGQPVELFRGERLRSAVIAPGGRWLALLVSFTADPAQDGLWLVNTESGERRKLEAFGAYRWRDAERLLIVPLEPGAASNRVLQIDAAGGEAIELVGPAQAAFRIANGDWSVSRDGQHILFLSAEDNNLWLLRLP